MNRRNWADAGEPRSITTGAEPIGISVTSADGLNGDWHPVELTNEGSIDVGAIADPAGEPAGFNYGARRFVPSSHDFDSRCDLQPEDVVGKPMASFRGYPPVDDKSREACIERGQAERRLRKSAYCVEIELDRKPYELLENLVKTGLFGSTIDEVAGSLILDGLRKACADAFLIVPRI